MNNRTNMKKLLITLTFSLFASLSFAGQLSPMPVTSCAPQVPYGQPVSGKENTSIVCRNAYILEHDNTAKIPDWVSYTLSPEHTTGCVTRTNKFEPDFSLPSGHRAELVDYHNSGYDRGHIANDADMTWSKQTELESLILSNMTPQLHGLNAGIWKDLETNVRAWAFNRQHTMLVYAGPIYNVNEKRFIGPDHVVIPSAFYKIVVDTKTQETLAFIFPHKEVADSNDLQYYAVSVAEVEKQTGISFNVPVSKTVVGKVWSNNLAAVEKQKQSVCHR